MDLERKISPAAAPGKIKVCVAYNLKKNETFYPPDAEAELDEYDTILAIRAALESAGYAVELFEANGELPGRLNEHRPDIVFNIAEGLRGRAREAQLPAILDYLSIPYTGSDETAMCIALDKALTKRLVSSYHIRTPKYKLFGPGDRISARGLVYPVIVKPNSEGSGMGITEHSVASDFDELYRVLTERLGAYGNEMLVEEFIAGREFTVGILGNGESARVFPPMEIRLSDAAHGVYSYNVKRDFRQYAQYACPADIDTKIMNIMINTARRVFRILACKDCARVDFRLDSLGRVYFIEINPLPGLAPGYSDFPMLAEFCGVGYTQLITGILEHALARYGLSAHPA